MRGPLTLPKYEAALPVSKEAGPDSRLIEFARALARQAAREAWEAHIADKPSETSKS